MLALLAKAIVTAERLPDSHWCRNPVDSLFDKGLSQPSQRCAAICFLRLLSVDDDCFDDEALRIKVFGLFDSQLEDVYAFLRINQTTKRGVC